MKEFNVWLERNKQFISFDIFKHSSFNKALLTLADENKFTEQELRREISYYFWAKCEYEILLSDWPCDKAKKKISVYDQIMINWKLFYEIAKENYLPQGDCS